MQMFDISFKLEHFITVRCLSITFPMTLFYSVFSPYMSLYFYCIVALIWQHLCWAFVRCLYSLQLFDFRLISWDEGTDKPDGDKGSMTNLVQNIDKESTTPGAGKYFAFYMKNKSWHTFLSDSGCFQPDVRSWKGGPGCVAELSSCPVVRLSSCPSLFREYLILTWILISGRSTVNSLPDPVFPWVYRVR